MKPPPTRPSARVRPSITVALAAVSLLAGACAHGPASQPNSAGNSLGRSSTSSPTNTPQNPDRSTRQPAAGTTTSIAIGDRRFRLYVPVGYSSGSPAALVMALHGWGGTSQSIATNLGLYPLSDTRKFLLVLPDGTSDPDGLQFWNATDACCDAYGSNVQDSAYLSRVIDQVDDLYDVDPARVFVIGISNGGFMAHRFACEHADQVAAIVSISGAQNANPTKCHPSRVVSVLEVHGTTDAKVRFDGGSSLGHRYPSVDKTVQTWRALEHCSGPRHQQAPIDADAAIAGAETTRSWWGPCAGSSVVGLWTARGSGHAFIFAHGFSDSLLEWLYSHSSRNT